MAKISEKDDPIVEHYEPKSPAAMEELGRRMRVKKVDDWSVFFKENAPGTEGHVEDVRVDVDGSVKLYLRFDQALVNSVFRYPGMWFCTHELEAV